ncbi:MAG TPA: cyclic-di-AMP receptor [Candidatus Dormibacteraeota bacterium]|nr:cyclic-di-AMP receptor [Candidatus Dormibacteraeota bacterium]
MKLIMAIVHEQDAARSVEALASRGLVVTRLASEGGFLQQRNALLLLGVDDSEVADAIQVLREVGRPRHEQLTPPVMALGPGRQPAAVEVEVGRATVMVLALDEVEHL